MGSFRKKREERKALVLSARMLSLAGWQDVTVRNVSSRGMMLRCESPPDRNTFVEVRLQRFCVVGRVVWSSGTAFGINSQDIIDLSRLMSQSPASSRKGGMERRRQPRNSALDSARLRILQTENQSRVFARIFDWSAVALAVAAGAVVVTDLAGTALRQPLEITRVTLESSR